MNEENETGYSIDLVRAVLALMANGEHGLVYADLVADVNDGLKRLPKHHVRALWAFAQGYSYREIGVAKGALVNERQQGFMAVSRAEKALMQALNGSVEHAQRAA